jgi:phage baseplate assembly protein W
MATYTDLNDDYLMSANKTDIIITDIQNVKDSLMRLFTTGKGEVPFNREYGTTLKTLLFETALDPADIANYLYMDVTSWEPRVRLNPADIDIIQVDNNTYKVICTFTVLGVNGNPQTISTLITSK